MGITVIRNYHLEDEVKGKLQDKYNKDREGIHVSDVTFCFLQRMLLAIHPEKKSMTWKKAKAFERGIQSEATIVSLYPEGDFQKEGKFMKYFEAHPDLIIRDGKLIVELKNTDKGSVIDPTSDDFMLYLRQLVYYMVLNEVERGAVLISHNSKILLDKGDDLIAYEVIIKMNDPLRETLKKNLERFEFFYEKIVIEKKHEYIEQIPRLATYPISWKCSYCDVKEECKALNVKATSEDKRIILNFDIDSKVTAV